MTTTTEIRTFVPSPEQATFLDFTRTSNKSCVLEAVAGSGKTSTILEAVTNMNGVAILAYNKEIANEIKAKLVARNIDWKQAEAGTVHSFGFRAYRKAFPNVRVDTDGQKVASIIANLGTYASPDAPVNRFGGGIAKLVSFAKQCALGIKGSIDDQSIWFELIEHYDMFVEEEDADEVMGEIVKIAISVLKTSNSMVDVVDFDDMVYLPVLLRVRFWGYNVIFVDEAQDTNEARRCLVRAMLRAGGRVIAVGDRHQAIYGFTGANSNSLDLIADDFSAERLPLSVTFRCPKAVVKLAQTWVSHITAHESAPEGTVTTITEDEFMKRDDLVAGNAVLCRNTKPLIKLAFALIRARIACRVEGRDLGHGLKKMVTRWKRITTLGALEEKLVAWRDKQVAALKAKKKEAKAQEIEDQIETLLVIIDECRREKKTAIIDVETYIDSLFGDGVKDMLVLSTIHKSKGREWKTVFWYDRAGTLPSKYARQPWQIEQENNLCYVAATRAMENLVEVKP